MFPVMWEILIRSGLRFQSITSVIFCIMSVTFVKLLNRNNSHRKFFVLVWSVETQQFAGPYSQLTAVGSGLNENLQTVGSDLQDLIGLGIGLHEPGKTNTQQKQWF